MQRRDFLKRIVTGAAVLATQEPVSLLPEIEATSRNLLWYVENLQGRAVSTWQPDRLANPASVTKLSTSLLALHHYRPSFRYQTRFVPDGTIDLKTCTLRGDLQVVAGGDPDFHFENALLVATGLNRLGIERVTGDVVIRGRFHMGWDKGRVPSGEAQWERYLVGKGTYLRHAWDADQWRTPQTRAWGDLHQQLVALGREEALDGFHGLKIEGGIRVESAQKAPPAGQSVIHYSNPLLRMLKRFNSYSNNDIERIGQQLGGPSGLRKFLVQVVGMPASKVRLSSTSGLGKNRLSPRAAVQSVRSLIQLSKKQQFELTDLLPVAGVDEGTLSGRFVEPGYSGSIVAKSGQLIRTDRGVATLSGVTYTQQGPLLFAIFYLHTYRHVVRAKKRIDKTLTELIDRNGGPAPLDYTSENLPFSYDQVQVEIVR